MNLFGQPVQPEAWEADALCAQVDPELFFPDKGQSSKPAKAICAACPVREVCLDRALASGEQFGIWGGETAYDRKLMLRAGRRAVA
ncbi:WhiB family transcription factor [Mycobacterium phage Tierra]|uniref:WhiB family transcription factor n=1 Tax=Mycobacterium phage Bryler TaxID=2653755 RepID=A0A5Q2WRZ4_9CAUD|nr:WhiB transcriptional factor [Mycobacterium phage Bryler]ASR85352.1 WhiB family transcription factor [Mycobacterium phage Phrank]ASR85453.1 WhiB family transcription factor [Mycobacterium phage Cain]QGH80429.1 WhiB family transcription factor [Mycobacterium phage Bryler]WNM68343.1 WhiB family transcription factor [Mycobacterium phage Tierra]